MSHAISAGFNPRRVEATDLVHGQPSGKQLIEAGLLPGETKWFALKIDYKEPVKMQAEWHISEDDWALVGQPIPDLIEQGVLPPRTVAFSIDAALDRVVTIKAEWVLSVSQYFHVLSILTKEATLVR